MGFSTDGRFVVTGWSSDGGPASTSPAMVRDVRTGRPVGPGFHAPRDFFYLGLSHDGQAVLIEEGSLYGGKRLLVYSASDSRCTLARPMQNATNTLTFSPDGRRVALCDQADGGAGVVEVRDAASGRLIAAPLATPDSSSHLDFSADGRLLAIECRGSVRLLDVKTGLPLGPWLPYQSYRAISGDLPNNDFRIAAADAALMTRYDVLNDHVMGSRFRLWDLKADARPIEQLTALAELHAGRRLDDAGRVVPLTLDDYRRRWQGRAPGIRNGSRTKPASCRRRFPPRPRLRRNSSPPVNRCRARRRRTTRPSSSGLAGPTGHRCCLWPRRCKTKTRTSVARPWTPSLICPSIVRYFWLY